MSTVLAYALSVLLNMGILSSSDVNRNANNYRVVEQDGQTILIDSVSGTEFIITA